MAKAYLVGAGPGDPGLLTLAGFSVIRTADVVLYDRLVGEGVLALIPPDVEKVYVGKLEGEQDKGQRLIFQKLLLYVNEGKTIVRLKGGEPFVFGRGMEEFEFLSKMGCEVRYIPGISSSISGAGLAGIPLTSRGVASSFTIVSGRLQSGEIPDWSKYGKLDTLVVLMGVSQRVRMASELIQAGRPESEPVAIVRNCSLPEQNTTLCTLGEMASGLVEAKSPAVIVIGEVVSFAPEESIFSDGTRVETSTVPQVGKFS